MTVFKCKMCGGTLEIKEGSTVAVCEYCDTKQTIPRLDNERIANLYDRANHFRRNNEFDKAAGIYEQILNEDNTDAESYWSLVLCRYGIEYVEDPLTGKRVPTVNRTQFTSIFDDDNYRSALQYADSLQKEVYENEAKSINEIQKGILAISQKEKPFDVFICYKETDADGRRTQDSVLANDLYHQLTQEGFKVFFARITLEDKLGTAYEPYIFAALNSAKVMVVLGTKSEYFNAVWVKNEWSRYLAIVKTSNGKKVLIPAYRDMDPYDLPDEFSHLQAQDMSKLGFMQDLIRGIKKIIKSDEAKSAVNEPVLVNDNGNAKSNVAPLLERAFMFLEDRNLDEADNYFERVLDQDPKNTRAYLGKLMIDMEVSDEKELENCIYPFDDSSNYQKILRFGDKEYVEYISKINEKIKNDIYDSVCKIMKDAAETTDSQLAEKQYTLAVQKLKLIPRWKDASNMVQECLLSANKKHDEYVLEEIMSVLDSIHPMEDKCEDSYNKFKTAEKLIKEENINNPDKKNQVLEKYNEIQEALEKESNYQRCLEEYSNIEKYYPNIRVEIIKSLYDKLIEIGDYKKSLQMAENCKNTYERLPKINKKREMKIRNYLSYSIIGKIAVLFFVLIPVSVLVIYNSSMLESERFFISYFQKAILLMAFNCGFIGGILFRFHSGSLKVAILMTLVLASATYIPFYLCGMLSQQAYIEILILSILGDVWAYSSIKRWLGRPIPKFGSKDK